jgi:hypothetical protein
VISLIWLFSIVPLYLSRPYRARSIMRRDPARMPRAVGASGFALDAHAPETRVVWKERYQWAGRASRPGPRRRRSIWFVGTSAHARVPISNSAFVVVPMGDRVVAWMAAR